MNKTLYTVIFNDGEFDMATKAKAKEFYDGLKNTQTAFLSDVRARKWIVGSVDAQGNVSFSANPARHDTEALAKAETDRLGATYPGKAFIYVQLKGAILYPTATKQVF